MTRLDPSKAARPEREDPPPGSSEPPRHDDPGRDADRFCAAFPAAYLAFHRRDGPRDELSGASRAVLAHLGQAGPSTIGELAGHLQRAQSVVSEIVTQLEGHGRLEREPDPGDRRRTLVWLTEAGRARLARDREVLEPALVATAMARLAPVTRAALVDGLDALVRAAWPDEPVASRPATAAPPPTHPLTHHESTGDDDDEPDL